MPSLKRHLFPLAGVVVAGVALVGCTGGDDAAPTTASPTPQPERTTPAATADSWAGYFDDVVAAADVGQYLWQAWGTFGDPGGVAPFRSENRTVERGVYDVTLRCAGPETVTAQISTSAGVAVGDPVPFVCGASTAASVTLPDRGMLVYLDSDREPGAFLMQVAPAGE
ncbi:hypothetical protein [Microbacterium sp. lyk4-40-TSB-66]|uniref:hypothetical protein n=1 Tax=Microbacterium sp. lyk4-40-TSB-66 TaxID=3040294 RepID=UPI002549F32A|nr:hypothetical protein [Microbacterium sp. lyk4-40-TSB-66]